MKNTITIVIACLLATTLLGQSKEHSIAKSSGTLIIAGLNEVTVVGHDGNEIVFSTKDYEDEVDERAAGLRLINSIGLTDNTGMGLATEEQDGNIIVTQISSSCDSEFEIKVPRGMSLQYEHTSNSGGDIVVEDIEKEIVIATTYGDVVLENITGPMAVKSVYGSIEATFESVSQEGSISLESVYDLVDVTIPGSTKADMSLRTPYGEIYSNVDINVEKKDGLRKISSKSIKGSVNGGGVDFSIKASYDNIYLRQK